MTNKENEIKDNTLSFAQNIFVERKCFIMSNEKHSCCTHKDKEHTGCSCGSNKELKNEGNNSWDSVPRTYDKEESFHYHEKTATDNQWTSTNK